MLIFFSLLNGTNKSFKCDLTFKLNLLKGDVSEAKKMIAAAAEAGADCVKFQKSCLKVISWKSYLKVREFSKKRPF